MQANAAVEEAKQEAAGPASPSQPAGSASPASPALSRRSISRAAGGSPPGSPSPAVLPSALLGPDNNMIELNLAKHPEDAQPSYQPSSVDVNAPYLERVRTAGEAPDADSDSDSDESDNVAQSAQHEHKQHLMTPAADVNHITVDVAQSAPAGSAASAASSGSPALKPTMSHSNSLGLPRAISVDDSDELPSRSHTMSRADVVQLQLQDMDRQLHQVHEAERQLSAAKQGEHVSQAEVMAALSASAPTPVTAPSSAGAEESKVCADGAAKPADSGVEERAVAVEKALQAAAAKIADEEAKQNTSKALGDWLRAGGFALSMFALFLFAIAQVSRIMSDWWISQWTTFKFDSLNGDKYNYIYIYIGLVFLFAVLVYFRGTVFYGFSTTSATVIHNRTSIIT